LLAADGPMPPLPTSRSRRAAAALWGLVAAATCLWAAGPVTTNDVYWHLETGELLARAGGFPARDPFSFTATYQLWYLNEWLTQQLFYGC
jgi:hypothetical protein